jgi:hypothetical protein
MEMDVAEEEKRTTKSTSIEEAKKTKREKGDGGEGEKGEVERFQSGKERGASGQVDYWTSSLITGTGTCTNDLSTIVPFLYTRL